MRIVVCDDEKVFVDIITEYSERFEDEFHIQMSLIKFQSGQDVISYVKQDRTVDLFILDIMMTGVNGLQVAKEIREYGSKARIVFLTSVLRYAPEGYNYGVKYYWMKPLSYQKFAHDIKKIYQELLKEERAFLVENIGATVEKVFLSDIIYIETKGRKVYVHRKNENYLSTRRMTQYERILDNRFYRCHAAYIVNMEHVIKIQGLEIELSNQDCIYMSKGRKKSFLIALSEYLEGII